MSDYKEIEKHAGGRPPIYDPEKQEDVLKVAELCEGFFTYIQGEYERVVNPDDEEDITVRTIRDSEYPSVTGLTLFLGFDSKSTLYDYAKKDKFSYPIKRALTKIEQFHEFRVSHGDKCTGNIFALKNMGWFDAVKTDVTTNGKDLPAPPSALTIEIIKPIED